MTIKTQLLELLDSAFTEKNRKHVRVANTSLPRREYTGALPRVPNLSCKTCLPKEEFAQLVKLQNRAQSLFDTLNATCEPAAIRKRIQDERERAATNPELVASGELLAIEKSIRWRLDEEITALKSSLTAVNRQALPLITRAYAEAARRLQEIFVAEIAGAKAHCQKFGVDFEADSPGAVLLAIAALLGILQDRAAAVPPDDSCNIGGTAKSHLEFLPLE